MKKFKQMFNRKKLGAVIPLHDHNAEQDHDGECNNNNQQNEDESNLYSEIKSSLHNFKEVDWFGDLDQKQNTFNNWHGDEETFNLDYIKEDNIKDDIITPVITVTNDHGDDEITLAYCKDDQSDNTSNDDDDEEFNLDHEYEIIPSCTIPKLERMDSLRDWNASSKPFLNQDTFFCIYVFLEDVFDILRLSQVCQASYSAFRDPYLWRNDIKKRTITSISMNLYPELNNSVVDEKSGKQERMDVIYKYCRLLMDNKVDGIRRGDGIKKAQKTTEIANIEKKKQAIKDSEQKLLGLISIIVVSFLLGLDFLRAIMSLIAYLVYFGASFAIPIIIWFYYSKAPPKNQKKEIFKQYALPICFFSSAVFLYKFSFVNTIIMIGCTLFTGYLSGHMIVEKRVQKQFLVLNENISVIRKEIDCLEKETSEKVEQLMKITRRIPTGYKPKVNRRESPTTASNNLCMIQ